MLEQMPEQANSGTVDPEPLKLKNKMNWDFKDMYDHEGEGVRNLGFITDDHPFTLIRERWGQKDTSPYISLCFYGDNGYIRIDIWGEATNESVLVSEELYSQGLDGKIRNKGLWTIQMASRILVGLSMILKRRIVNVNFTHSHSEHLPPLIGMRESSCNEIRIMAGSSQAKNIISGELSYAEKHGNSVWIKEYDPTQPEYTPNPQSPIPIPQSPIPIPFPFTPEEIQKIEWMCQYLRSDRVL